MSEKVEKVTYDKSKWGKGEWDNEPDRVDFIHAGFSCFILRNQCGNWCGYVGVPETHPYYKKHDEDINVDVHGGVTYTDLCSGHICHVPEPGMPENVWWIGFDTAHSGDLSPALHRLFADDVYKNMEYTIKEVKSLADQLEWIAMTKV